jgi:geranylgeranyl diphosphate synthase type II
MLFDDHWKTQLASVEAALSRAVAAIDDCPPRLQEAMAYSLMAGGKRLRPMLVLAACEAVGGRPETAMPAAVAVEMVHTYSLIHDDLPAMDDDQLRRGRPTSHVVFGEALAILAGDALLTLAFEVLARDVSPGSLAAACCVDLASGAGRCGMVAGQVLDIAAETEPVTELIQLEAIHRRKTGRLLTSCLTMGGRIGGAAPRQLQSLEEYGQNFGLAFQITDDLLDVSGSAEKIGKAVGKDAAAGKATYPVLLGLDASRRRAGDLIAAARSAVASFDRPQRLDALARFVLERDH